MRYILSIVDNDYNITQAAKSFYISQPGLSKALTNLEEKLNFKIFEREKGRLVALTKEGEIIYNFSKDIIRKHNTMLNTIENLSLSNTQGIRLGVPPVVVTLFGDLFEEIRFTEPNLRVRFIEHGSYELEKLLEIGELDYCVLLNTEKIHDKKYDHIEVSFDEYAIFVDNQHKLAPKENIKWEDLQEAEIVLADQSHKTYHVFTSMLKFHNIRIRQMITDYSWSYSITLIKNSNLISFLPMPLKEFINMEGLKAISFLDPVPWKTYFVWRKKEKYTSNEKTLINLFKSKYGN